MNFSIQSFVEDEPTNVVRIRKGPYKDVSFRVEDFAFLTEGDMLELTCRYSIMNNPHDVEIGQDFDKVVDEAMREAIERCRRKIIEFDGSNDPKQPTAREAVCG